MLPCAGTVIAPAATGAQSLKPIFAAFRLFAPAPPDAELREEDIATWRTNP
jgi:hypothetical protein